MKKNKTTETQNSVEDFIDAIANETKRDDSRAIIELYKKQTGFEPKLWGPSIIGFGQYHYVYESGHEGDAPLAAFSPRKEAIVFYLCDYEGRDQMLAQLGKHKLTKGCVYVKKLEDIDVNVLKKLITGSMKSTKAKYG